MALLERCFCCSLLIVSGFLAVYLLIAYLIAFAFELLWILESDVSLPIAAVLLCLGYFTFALFAALLIHGLVTKNTACLVLWMFAVTILTFPEAGMVVYMSIHYWRIETLYGMIELASWLGRLLINLVELIIIQSLYSLWKEEELVMKRLRDLNTTAIPIPRDVSMNSINNQAYQNNAFDNTMEQFHYGSLKRAFSSPQVWTGTLSNDLAAFPYDGFQFCTTQSEFNASIFMPNMPYDIPFQYPNPVKKTQSLMDLRGIDDNSLLAEKLAHHWPPWMSHSITETSNPLVRNEHPFDRRIQKISKYSSLEDLNDVKKESHIIRNRTGFYAQPLPNYGVPIYYGPLHGPDFLIYKKQIDHLSSKNSLSNTSADDLQKYRDVAL